MSDFRNLDRKIGDALEVLHHVAEEIEKVDPTLPKGAGATIVYLAALRGLDQEYREIFRLFSGKTKMKKKGSHGGMPTSVEDLLKRWSK